jgi:hypothetical protein
MQFNRFQVELVCQQRLLYHVDAADAGSAKRLAVKRWKAGESSDIQGFDWCQLESATATELSDSGGELQDEELVQRFISERERLLIKLGGNPFSASLSDTISAQQLATDLSWFCDGGKDLPTFDMLRAAEALERLCAKKRLVCFERERVRAGERGAIRLYFTAEYLERLSSSLEELQPVR